MYLTEVSNAFHALTSLNMPVVTVCTVIAVAGLTVAGTLIAVLVMHVRKPAVVRQEKSVCET